MTDEIASIAPEIAPAAIVSEAVQAPVESAPVVAPEVVVEAPKVAETILGSVEPPKITEPVVETKTTDGTEIKVDEQPTEQKDVQSDEPAPTPTYEEFKAPEGFALDAERIGDFTKALAEFEVKTKADHAEVQALGQQLVERHVTEVKSAVDRYTKSLLDQFEAQKTGWKEAFEKDPEIGGNRKDTTIGAALEFIRTHGGTTEQQAEFQSLMEQTGVGNHPAMIRMLAKANMALAEGKPLPASRPIPQAKGKLEKFYGGSM